MKSVSTRQRQSLTRWRSHRRYKRWYFLSIITTVFSYNLYQLIGEIDPDIKVIRNDEMTVSATFAHKYGHQGIVFHDVGIVLDSKPYIIVILSNGTYVNRKDIFQDISKKIYEFHKLFS